MFVCVPTMPIRNTMPPSSNSPVTAEGYVELTRSANGSSRRLRNFWRVAARIEERPGETPRPLRVTRYDVRLRVENSDDLVRAGIDNHDLVADHDVVEAAPFGVDGDDFGRQRIEVHAVRNTRTDADRNIQVGWLHLVLSDHSRDLCALLGRELGRARRGALAGRGRARVLGLR